MTTINIDWNAIRPLNGSRADSFEELCTQLAEVERPKTAAFERKGTPDGGVECYAIFGDGSEWGWQAKYWDNWGDSQWPQLDHSVKTALEKHPRLVRYYVCVPLDRSDPRVDGRRSAKDRWDDHISKWAGWATSLGMSVEFVYWGSHELLQMLTRPEHVGRVRLWFNVQGFDGAWFTARLDEAIKSAGPRYTPLLHIDLPISEEFGAFGRTELFFSKVKSLAIGLRKAIGTFMFHREGIGDASIDVLRDRLAKEISDVLHALGTLSVQPTGPLPLSQIASILYDADVSANMLDDALSKGEQEIDTRAKSGEEGGQRSRSEDNVFRGIRHRLRTLRYTLAEMREKLKHTGVTAGSTLMVLKGAAGTGKTHILCDEARHRVVNNRPTILLMGQRFLSTADPWSQALQQLDLPGITVNEFVGCLEAVAQAAQCRALVIIDAINEGTGRELWPAHLPAFLAALCRSEWISVLLSVRTSYEEIVIPEDIRQDAVSVTHFGFADHEYDATRTFFAFYGLELPSTPLLAPEFRNPLFLKSLCSGLHARGERRLPRGFQGISYVLDLYLRAANDRLARTLDFNPKAALPRQALEALAGEIAQSRQRWLPMMKAAEVIDALLPGRGFERSLYHGLVTEGVLIEEAGWPDGTDREVVVLISYDRFADHLIAKVLLDRHLASDTPAAAFSTGAGLGFLSDVKHYVAPGLLEALCIQVPERTGQELVQRFHETSCLCGIPISAQHVVGCWSNNPWLDTHGSTSTRNRYLDWRRRPGAVGEHRSVSNGTSELG